jgi:hypothetical protein
VRRTDVLANRPVSRSPYGVLNDCHAATVSDFSGYADVNGLSMFYEVHGDGPPLLHLSGGTCSNEAAAEDIAALSRNFEVIAPE